MCLGKLSNSLDIQYAYSSLASFDTRRRVQVFVVEDVVTRYDVINHAIFISLLEQRTLDPVGQRLHFQTDTMDIWSHVLDLCSIYLQLVMQSQQQVLNQQTLM